MSSESWLPCHDKQDHQNVRKYQCEEVSAKRMSRWDIPLENNCFYNDDFSGYEMQNSEPSGSWRGCTQFVRECQNQITYWPPRALSHAYQVDNYNFPHRPSYKQRYRPLYKSINRNPNSNPCIRFDKFIGNKQLAFKSIDPSELKQFQQPLSANASKAVSNDNNEALVLPGSEAARERERAAIAQRLKDLDKDGVKGTNVVTASKNFESKDVNINTKRVTETNIDSVNHNKKNKKFLDRRKPKKRINSSKSSKNKIPNQTIAAIPQTSKTSKRRMPIVKLPLNKKFVKKSKISNKSASENASEKISKKISVESSKELKKQILARLSEMGKDELRFIIRNPHSVKSQDFMKALMKCYQESKDLELDKRRFAIAQIVSNDVPSSSTQQEFSNPSQAGYNFTELSSIAMTDLPQEVVTQIESFLGCNLSSVEDNLSPLLLVNDSSISDDVDTNQSSFNNVFAECQQVVLGQQEESFNNQINNYNVPSDKACNNSMPTAFFNRDAYSDSEVDQVLYPGHLNMTLKNNDQIPFLILAELSRIDKDIQESIDRKMKLYQQLHCYLEHSSKIKCNESSERTENFEEKSINEEAECERKPNARFDDCFPVPTNFNKSHFPYLTVRQLGSHLPTVNTNILRENNTAVDENIVLPDKVESTSCHECRQLDFEITPLQFEFPTKTNVNVMKVVSKMTVVLGCEDGDSYAYSLQNGKLTHTFQGHASGITAVCGVQDSYESDKFELCSGGLDEHLFIFDSFTQQIISKHYMASSITCLEMELDHNDLLYIGLSCGQILIYNLKIRQLLDNRLECDSSITAILPTREGPRKVLIVAAKNKSLAMRDAASGLLLRTFQNTTTVHSYSLAIYADRMYSGVILDTIPVFDLMSGQKVDEIRIDGTVSCIRLYKHLLFVASFSGKISVFDLKTRETVCLFYGSGLCLKTIQIHNNGVIICSRSKVMETFFFPKLVRNNLKAACPCQRKQTPK